MFWMMDLLHFYLIVNTRSIEIKRFLATMFLTLKRLIFPPAAGTWAMVSYIHGAHWVYLRGSSSTGKSVFFLIPLASVRQRGSHAEMLDVSGRGEWEWNWVTGGADGAAHQRLMEQRPDEWSNAAALLMNPWNHGCPPVFPCDLNITSHLIRTQVCDGDISRWWSIGCSSDWILSNRAPHTGVACWFAWC